PSPPAGHFHRRVAPGVRQEDWNRADSWRSPSTGLSIYRIVPVRDTQPARVRSMRSVKALRQPAREQRQATSTRLRPLLLARDRGWSARSTAVSAVSPLAKAATPAEKVMPTLSPRK